MSIFFVKVTILHFSNSTEGTCLPPDSNHSKLRAVRDRIRPPWRTWSGSGVSVQIRSPEPDYFLNLMRSSFSKDTAVINFFNENPTTLFGDMSQIVEKCPSRNVEESFKNFMDPYREADDCQNLISSSLCTDTPVVKFFVKTRSVVFMQSC